MRRKLNASKRRIRRGPRPGQDLCGYCGESCTMARFIADTRLCRPCVDLLTRIFQP